MTCIEFLEISVSIKSDSLGNGNVLGEFVWPLMLARAKYRNIPTANMEEMCIVWLVLL